MERMCCSGEGGGRGGLLGPGGVLEQGDVGEKGGRRDSVVGDVRRCTLGGLLMELCLLSTYGRSLARDTADRSTAAALEKPPKACPAKKFTVPQLQTPKAVKSHSAPPQPPDCAQTTAAMKLNVKNIRYLTPEDWRVLTAVPIPSLSPRTFTTTLPN